MEKFGHMSTFDLSAKIVTSDQNAWVVHAGRSLQHSKVFRSSQVVFLETPYLKLDDVNLDDKKEVRQALRRSEAFEKHHQTTGSSVPSAVLSDYESGVFEDSKLTALAGGIARMFGKMKVGDVVMSPGIHAGVEFNTPVIQFGEIIKDFDPQYIISGGSAKSQSVPARQVNWLRTVNRKEISLYLERKIGKPPALRNIIIEKDTEEILRHAFNSYIFENTSSGLIEAKKYDGSEFITLTQSQHLIASLVAAHHAFSGNSTEQKISNFEEFVRENFEKSSIENIIVDFSSPGYWRLVGASASMAAFVGLGVAIFTSNLDLPSLAKELVVLNTVSTPGDTEIEIQENMKTFLRSLDNLDIKKLQQTGLIGKEEIGLSSSVRELQK